MVKIGEDLFDYRYLGRMFDAMRALGAGEIEAYQSKDDRIGSIAVFVGQGAHGKITGLVMPVHRGHHADVKTQVRLFGEERNAGEWRPSANWTAATNKAIQAEAGKLKRKGTKFSRAIVGGKTVAVVDDIAGAAKINAKNPHSVEAYVLDHLENDIEMLVGGAASITEKSAAHLAWSKTRGFDGRQMRQARAKAATVIADLIKMFTADGSTKEAPKKGKNGIAWRCRLPIAIPKLDTKHNVIGVAGYDADVVIKDEGDGKFFYDISHLKQNGTLTGLLDKQKEILFGSQNTALPPLQAGFASGVPVADIIPNSGPRSQARFSQRFNPARADIRFSVSGLYTGSAADYDKPSLHYVGTGEGAQVYGWGLYGSNVRGVAEGYAKSNAEAYSEQLLRAHNGDRTKAVEEALRDYNEAYMARSGNAETFRQTLEILQGERKPEQHLYEQTFFTNRATGDEKGGEDEQVQNRFQFTPVVRRATKSSPLFTILVCFNSRPSCDGRLPRLHRDAGLVVSIHARRATGDRRLECDGAAHRPFQFTPVVRRATNLCRLQRRGSEVSIHARRATGDLYYHLVALSSLFQFTPVVRRATQAFQLQRLYEAVSIHARRATGDRLSRRDW